MAAKSSKAGGKGTEKSKVSFEKKLAELEDIVQQLEHGEKPLEESIKLYERGEKARKACLEILDSFEKRIRVLRKDAAGQAVLEDEVDEDDDFDADEDDEDDPTMRASGKQRRMKKQGGSGGDSLFDKS